MSSKSKFFIILILIICIIYSFCNISYGFQYQDYNLNIPDSFFKEYYYVYHNLYEKYIIIYTSDEPLTVSIKYDYDGYGDTFSANPKVNSHVSSLKIRDKDLENFIFNESNVTHYTDDSVILGSVAFRYIGFSKDTFWEHISEIFPDANYDLTDSESGKTVFQAPPQEEEGQKGTLAQTAQEILQEQEIQQTLKKVMAIVIVVIVGLIGFWKCFSFLSMLLRGY